MTPARTVGKHPWLCSRESDASGLARPSRRHQLISGQTACDVRRQRQLTQGKSIALPASLMERVRMLLSRIGLPSRTDWNTRSFGLSDLTILYLRTARPALTSTVRQIFHAVNPLNHRAVHRDCGVTAFRSWGSPNRRGRNAHQS